MSVNLSFIGGAGWQFFDNNGRPLNGGKIYTYAAGTTTPQTTYTSWSGNIPNSNPIILDSAGRTPEQIWSTEGLLYKYVVADSDDVIIRTWDNIGGSVVASDLASDLANTSNNAKGDALIGFKQSNISGFITGAVGKTVNDKLQELFSVKDFGAVGDGVTNDTDAFAAASTAINAAGGGKLIIPPGTYILGKQLFAGAFGKGYAYQPSPMLTFTNCTKPVIVEGNGAVLKIASGLRFGSFNPSTGQPYYPPSLPFLNPDYTAAIGSIIAVTGCDNVVIKNLELDGNINNAIIGGQWNDAGIQLRASGITSYQNKNFRAENVYTHHHGLDGVEIGWTGLTASTQQLYPHSLQNVVSQYNGRQGLSWVGGNNLSCVSCDFSFTAKNGAVASSPGAGVDIEPEASICINGTFINCRFFNNNGGGMTCVSVASTYDCSFYNCKFIGTTFNSIYATGERYTFYGCEMIGAVTNVLGGDPKTASKFYGCTFSMTAANSPTGTIYDTYHNFYGGDYILFEGCNFDADANHQLPWMSGYRPIISNCNFKGLATTGVSYTAGIFVGYNKFENQNTNYFNGLYFGLLYINGVLNSVGPMPSTSTLTIDANDGGAGKKNRQVSYYDPVAWTTLVGTAVRGDIVWLPNPTAGSYAGWICTTGGDDVTAVWKTFGAITA